MLMKGSTGVEVTDALLVDFSVTSVISDITNICASFFKFRSYLTSVCGHFELYIHYRTIFLLLKHWGNNVTVKNSLVTPNPAFVAEPTLTCDFENAYRCGYVIESLDSNFRWEWGKADTPSDHTGPLIDNTLKSTQGKATGWARKIWFSFEPKWLDINIYVYIYYHYNTAYVMFWGKIEQYPIFRSRAPFTNMF